MATDATILVSAGAFGRQQLLARIRGEYREMPGLSLRVEQARRLWHLDDALCGELLESLVEARFLRLARDGRYIRVDGGRA